LDRNLGEMERAGKTNPQFQPRRRNWPAVSRMR
jgi:hypothetical protein